MHASRNCSIYPGMFGLIALLAAVVQASAPMPEDFGHGLLALDREISGLLDCYLEAVPECPAGSDTPIRLWQLDLGWIRASSALLALEGVRPGDAGPAVAEALEEYLAACKRYLAVYGRVRVFYHGAGHPDSAMSVALEDELISADSAWLESGARLFGALNEEE